MLTKILIGTLFAGMLVYSGCDSSDNQPLSDNYTNAAAQTMLDNKNYAGVINVLENNAYTNGDYITLGSAYMGLSGLNINDVINKICNSGDSEGGSLMSFTNSVRYDKEKCDVPLSYLNKATNYFMKVVGDKCTTAVEELSSFEKAVCVYKGLSQTMEAVTTLNYIKQDSSKITDDTVDTKLIASSCAMEYAFNGSRSICGIYEKGSVYFRENDKHYEQITVYVYTDDKEYEFLLTEGKNSTKEVIVTDGYCALDDYSTRVDNKTSPGYNSSYHVCPINLNEDVTTKNIDNFTTNEFIINSFNEGTNAILKGSDNEVLIKAINSFKQEIYDTREGNNKSKEIDEEDMVKYLNKQNMQR